MSRAVSYCALIAAATVVAVLTTAHPEVLSNKNDFLKGFVDHEFLGIVGVMLTITLASAGQIHLTLNEIEVKHGKVFLTKTRATVRSAAYGLIILFLLSTLLVIVRSATPPLEWVQSACNGAALVLLLWQTLVMAGLTQLIFAIKPEFG